MPQASSSSSTIQVVQPKQAFVAIHDENLLSELSSSPSSSTTNGTHSEPSNNKLLEKVNKVDPHYVPHLQNHQTKQHHQKHLSDEHTETHPLGVATYYTPQIITDEDDEEDEEEEAMLSQHHHDVENGVVVSSPRYQTQEIDNFHQERKKFITRKLFENFSLRDLIVKWRYSIIYSLYLLIMSGLAAFLFAWAIYKRGKIEEIWFLALEGFCTFAIVYECFLSIFLYRRHWYKRIIVWCNIFVSLAAIVIFSLLLYCFIENQENYFWSNVAFAEEVLIGFHCTVNALRIFIYILQIRRGRTIMTNNPIFLDTSTPTTTGQNETNEEGQSTEPQPTQYSYGTVSNAN
ncbi:hypothetical protein C9374_007486 [Naegleria lovaniensis]|uniref:Transmembrane protein n=1 Tax=Naegleria lovaniensis TaxID=51637 RepID=A0AA88KGN3_NAELO|nr:uncharacterized protein C9374_007486 [Naegleria lovaniensis]KAG2379347.1 hypothetical protein C9374_007486 [Naegleria lovaniensis]